MRHHALLGELAKSGPDAVIREQAPSRIARRVLKVVEEGGTEYGIVKGGLFGIVPTTHEPEVYAAAAAQLSEEGVEIEARRFEKPVAYGLPGAETGVRLTRLAQYDTINVTSIGGEAVARAQETDGHDGHLQRLYPPA